MFVGTVDVLRLAMKDGLLKTNVPVLFDDLTPGLPRGSRPPMNLDDIAKFSEVLKKSTINARNADISMAEGMPKVVTTNAVTPFAWHPDLLDGILTMSPEARKLVSTKVKAVFKRCIFCNITAPLYQAQDNRVAQATRRASAGSSMDHLFQ